jgi:hypothetical protein
LEEHGMNHTEPVVDSTTPAELVQRLSKTVRDNYVYPDVAEEICARLQQRLDEGAYEGITEGEFLAYALTHHLQEVNGDEHLWVRWTPEPLPEHEGQLRHNPEWLAKRRLEAQLDSYGLHKLERLPGNVGYLEIHRFHRPAWAGDAAVAAMQILANTSALIVDLRRCPGGYPGMVSLLLSYLFGEEPIHLGSIFWHDDDITQQYWTLPYVPGKRFGDKPVYVLTSRGTFSGGEAFAQYVQAQRRGMVVGEKTDGGAHPGAQYRLHAHFEAFIPIGQSIDPVTGGDWQESGVTPDVPVPAEQALSVAYRLALASVIERLGAVANGPLGALSQEAQDALDELDGDDLMDN